MAEITQPSEIAREALRRLATRRIPPTPDNYRELYHEIAGTTAKEDFPERALKALAGKLPRATAEQARFGQQVDSAIGSKDWNAFTGSMQSLLKSFEAEPPDWPDLIRDLLGQMERRHAGITAAKKRDAIEHILKSAGADPGNLFERMQSLLRSWSKSGAGAESSALTGEIAPAAAPASEAERRVAPPLPSGGAEENRLPSDDLRELIAQLVEGSVSMLLIDTPELADEASALAASVRQARDAAAFALLVKQLKQFNYRLQFAHPREQSDRECLLGLGDARAQGECLQGDAAGKRGGPEVPVVEALAGAALVLREEGKAERQVAHGRHAEHDQRLLHRYHRTAGIGVHRVGRLDQPPDESRVRLDDARHLRHGGVFLLGQAHDGERHPLRRRQVAGGFQCLEPGYVHRVHGWTKLFAYIVRQNRAGARPCRTFTAGARFTLGGCP